MEAPLEEETPAGALAGIEGLDLGGELKASDEALTFLSSIEPAELLKCVFPDSLVTVSEGGRDLGRFSVTVEFARRVQQPCLLLHAQSQGAIDDSPCGTTVTAYLTTELEVLEEDYHEYVKLDGHSLDKKCHMVQHDGQMLINKVTTVGESALGLKQLEVGDDTVEVFGVERTVHSSEDSPITWQCYFLADGHMASRVQVGSPVSMRLLQLQSQLEKGKPLSHTPRKHFLMKHRHNVCVIGFEKIPLVWEEDMQMRSKFWDRKEELKADHTSYLRRHPEIRALTADFLESLLLRKPDDVFKFAREYFAPFAPSRLLETSPKASSL
ncbi:ciliogenesis-associated TTC17-interacting protein isoform X3 [Pungitius pungitius]|uniref:ciliogenesis-associated TTC17-interacting protein isoform X3 n=1 Tax=Pungitius pungitius TaxID=134920 RepID=UPI002E0E2808